jgi:hypothetical protein
MSEEVFLSLSSRKTRLLISCNNAQLFFDLLVFRYFGNGMSHSQTIRAILVPSKAWVSILLHEKVINSIGNFFAAKIRKQDSSSSQNRIFFVLSRPSHHRDVLKTTEAFTMALVFTVANVVFAKRKKHGEHHHLTVHQSPTAEIIWIETRSNAVFMVNLPLHLRTDLYRRCERGSAHVCRTRTRPIRSQAKPPGPNALKLAEPTLR